MGSTSSAEAILAACLVGRGCAPDAVRILVEQETPALFTVLAEGLSDRFEPRLVDAYAAIFSEVIAAALPEYRAADLVARYRRVREPRRCAANPRTVFVLSRVTLGADIAVTSVLLDGLKRRFPAARIVFAGPAKNCELFSADPRIEHLPVQYQRSGSLAERLRPAVAFSDPDSIVVDPDSRITQLGLLPVSAEARYYFFSSREYGGTGIDSLGTLARRWMAETFGTEDARPFLAPAEQPEIEPGAITVSLGVGGNAAKRVPDPFEAQLVAGLAAMGPLIVDAGAGGEEAARVTRAIGSHKVRTWPGSFAGFASLVSRSRLYAGYDSAGQHAAAACGVPLVTIFAGAPSERFRQRWRPTGPGPVEILEAAGRDPVSLARQAIGDASRLAISAR